MKIKYTILFVVSTVGIVLDQWTKNAIHTKFQWGESLPVIPSFFSLTYVRNSGAAFGILHKAPAYFRDPFFIIVPIVAMAIILFLFWRLEVNKRLTAFALSLILSGAVGNLIDRLRFGYVIDFLDFYWRTYHWPAFNVADSCIVVGVSLLFIMSLIQDLRKGSASPNSVPPLES